jgi:hypothetical protein
MLFAGKILEHPLVFQIRVRMDIQHVQVARSGNCQRMLPDEYADTDYVYSDSSRQKES